MKNISFYIFCSLAIISALITIGCAKKNLSADSTSAVNEGETPILAELMKDPGHMMNSKPVNFLPKATAFKMSGNYADNVAVTFDTSGRLIYFPAPSDISLQSRPLPLGNGWYLNRQGISQNSVFTKWTFKEYSSLQKVPTIEEIKNAVIPEAKITEFVTLPVTASEALQMSPADILSLIEKK